MEGLYDATTLCVPAHFPTSMFNRRHASCLVDKGHHSIPGGHILAPEHGCVPIIALMARPHRCTQGASCSTASLGLPNYCSLGLTSCIAMTQKAQLTSESSVVYQLSALCAAIQDKKLSHVFPSMAIIQVLTLGTHEVPHHAKAIIAPLLQCICEKRKPPLCAACVPHDTAFGFHHLPCESCTHWESSPGHKHGRLV